MQTVNIPVDVLLFEQVHPLLMWFSALLVTATTLSMLRYMRRVPVVMLGFGLSLASLYRMTAFTLGFAVLVSMLLLALPWAGVPRARAPPTRCG